MIKIVTQQIRRGVFETNSSSTHTITITDSSLFQHKPLVENNIFYPIRLDFSQPFINRESYDIQARTYEEKLAIYCLWIHGFDIEWDFDGKCLPKEELFDLIKADAGYDQIIFETDYSLSWYDDDYGDSDYDPETYFTSVKGFQELLDMARDNTKGLRLTYEQN